MEQQDGQVPAPRRASLPRRRKASPGPAVPGSAVPGPAVPGSAVPGPAVPGPAVPGPPRVADLSALLADIDALRTTLSTDLTLAAAALEAGADDVAGELVAGDLQALRSFEAQALQHLSSLDTPATPPAAAFTPTAVPVPVPVAVPAPVVVPLRRSRLMSAAPLIAAAAAAIGLFAGVVPSSTPSPAPSSTTAGLNQANYSLAMLSELVEQGATGTTLRDAAQELNEQLAELVANAEGNPVAARQALMLLQAGTQVLSDSPDQGALSEVLARTRELEAELRRVLPRAPRPVRVLAPSPTRLPLPVVKREQSSPSSPRPTREASSAPAAASSPASSPTPRPSTSPTPAPPAPEPTSSPEPAPSSSPTAADPLPRPPGLPG